LSVVAVTPKLNLRTKRGAPCEERTRQEVERLASKFDLGKYTVTRDIMIEQGAMAHSYPELTMNCRFLRDDDLLLSQYIHEQGHWLLMERHRVQMPRLFDDLQRLVPNLPVQPPKGDSNERSSYFHLAVIMLEWQALEDLVGPERAHRVMEWKRGDHYTAIYSAVLDKRRDMEKLLLRYDIKF
jgi:hypothetical protein